MTINRREFFKSGLALAGGVILPAELLGSNRFQDDSEYDIVVYGGTSGGVIAAVTAARKGRSVILIEPSNHLGGLTTGGLGRTDIGIEGTIGGMSLEFYSRIREYYKSEKPWVYEARSDYMNRSGLLEPESEGMFGFEPHVAKNVYKQMLEEAKVPVVMGERIILGDRGVDKMRDKIVAIETESGNVYKGQIFIDATYEGDLLAVAGVSYHVGREANATYDETLNGVQTVRTHNHIFPGFVDPYVRPGDPSSGVLPGVHDGDPGEEFSGDHRVQAYCFRMCLTDVPENQVPFEQPEGYDERQYELLFRNFEAGETRIPWLPGAMPNRKTDTNNRWGFSTNQIGVNYKYPDGDYATRHRIMEGQEHYQRGLMWTLANHPRVPEHIRDEVGKWGLAVDEFTDNRNWPSQIYVREARRMVGEYVTTEHDCRRLRIVEDPVGLGSYTMDSHNVQRYITEDGCVQNEGNIEVSPGGPYAISYRSLLPQKKECGNLLACCAVSSSHIAFGSIRMEPVFMLLGQSTATAAVQALEEENELHNLDYQKLRAQLIRDGQKLDVDTGKYPPLPPDENPPVHRERHASEPVIEEGCMVTRDS
ncbi:FAD-dependent oxidoreductase [Aliifodinibius sp. S!AR15-10]|uniref:FAD-dependent oxidoreductase n=1 Tax=Aliifodinibius sp. S!AR15-10 TaxID=2950437 RepID=UPI0028570200|nr:FAD-dependent oxidoreductase [Aliifodinibius sp. S!AR15-10]MDR8390374.1 FAD-dependent oxidoreductase [Aliifodinibius sp. S!AR15-10]